MLDVHDHEPVDDDYSGSLLVQAYDFWLEVLDNME